MLDGRGDGFDNTSAELIGTYERPRTLLVALEGTSITNQNGIPSGFESGSGNYFWISQGYWNQAAVLLGHRAVMSVNDGVGGSTTTAMLARIANVTGAAVDWCILEPGPNDYVGGLSLATVTANITAMLDALAAVGIKVALCTVTPSSYLSAAQNKIRGQVNDWIRGQAQTRRGVVLVDWAPVVTDPALTGGPLVSMFRAEGDGGHVHPNPIGAYAMGRVLANALSRVMPAVSLLADDPADTSNLLLNPFMQGTAGTPAGAPNNVTVVKQSGAAFDGTISAVARTDGLPGNWLQVVIPAGSDVQIVCQNLNVGTDFSVGDTVYSMIEFETDPDWDVALTQDLYHHIDFFGSTNPIGSSAYFTGDLHLRTSDGHQIYRQPKGVFRTPNMVVPAATTRLQQKTFLKGAGTLRVGRQTIRKV